MTKKIIFTLLYIILALVSIIFSLQNGEASSNESSFVTNIAIRVLNAITFNKINFEYDLIHLLIRKVIGHFSLFFLIGLFGYITYNLYFNSIKKAWIVNLIVAIFIVVTSEGLQLLSRGRSCEFKDMIIDYSGCLLATLICVLISFRNKKIKYDI